jgi:hypothetical protein
MMATQPLFLPTQTAAFDVNPADVIYDLLTHTRYGAGIAPTSIDQGGSFAKAAAYYSANSILISPVFKDRQQVLRHIEEILIVVDSFLTWSQGFVKLVPRQTFVSPRSITASSYVGGKSQGTSIGQTGLGTGGITHNLGRQTVKETINRVLIHYVARNNEYTPSAVDAVDYWMIGSNFGTELDVKGDMITSLAMANQVAFRILWVRSFNRLTAKLTLGPQDLDIDVTDVISWTDAAVGLNAVLFRVMSVSETKEGTISVEVIEENPAVLGWNTFTVTPDTVITALQPTGSGTATVLILVELPPPQTNGNPSIVACIAAVDKTWNGARIYVSDDNSTFTKITDIRQSTVWGVTA